MSQVDGAGSGYSVAAEQARSDVERAQSGSMEALHIMEGIHNHLLSMGGMLLGVLGGLLGSCCGCPGG